jgi:hypothetical protein
MPAARERPSWRGCRRDVVERLILAVVDVECEAQAGTGGMTRGRTKAMAMITVINNDETPATEEKVRN